MQFEQEQGVIAETPFGYLRVVGCLEFDVPVVDFPAAAQPMEGPPEFEVYATPNLSVQARQKPLENSEAGFIQYPHIPRRSPISSIISVGLQSYSTSASLTMPARSAWVRFFPTKLKTRFDSKSLSTSLSM
jgi:hypothetical protein